MSVSTPQVTGLRVLDEGVTVVNPAASMNMIGAGVTASDGGNGQASVSIPGGAGNTFVYGEKPTDNGNDTYTLAHTPVLGTVTAYKNGVRQNAGAGNDYTISGTTITNLATYSASDVWLVDYQF